MAWLKGTAPGAHRVSGRAALGPRGLAGLLALALLLVAPALARGQLADDATISTQGTQFVRPAPKPKPPDPPAKPPPPTAPRVAPPAPPPPPAAAVQPEPQAPPRYPEVVILLDTSDSMLNPIPGSDHTRLDEAKAALTKVVAGMPPVARLQLWTFNTRMHPLRIGNRPPGLFIPLDRPEIKAQLGSQVQAITTAGGTNLFQSVVKALDIFANPANQRLYRAGQRYPVLVVVSDGEDSGKTREREADVQKAKGRNSLVTVNTIGFKVSRNEEWFRTLCRIASTPTGCATAGDQAQLEHILEGFYRPPGK